MLEILRRPSQFARLRETYRHPDQATVLARLPLVGRRIPMRAYWRTQHVKPSRAAVHTRQRLTPWLDRALTLGIATAQRGEHAGQALASTCGHGVLAGSRRMAPLAKQVRPRGPLPMMLVGLAIGASAMYYADRAQGKRRRALVRDKMTHLGRVMRRDVPRTLERRGRFFRGKAQGVRHEAAALMHRNGGRPADDETLVARVRSHALRGQDIKAGEIHVDAYEGCVTLRGELQSPVDIRRMVEATKRIDGVREVRSYLHLPDELPPNKADLYAGEATVPAEFRS